MAKSADAFRSIGEVARMIGVAPHVLRYWETQFPQLSPVKRADGRRYYRMDDVRLAAGLCEVMRDDGMTTRGAARLIAEDKGAALRKRGSARLKDLMGDGSVAPPSPAANPGRPKASRRAKPAADLPLFGQPETATPPPAGDTATAPTTSDGKASPLARLEAIAAALDRTPRRRAALRGIVPQLRSFLDDQG